MLNSRKRVHPADTGRFASPDEILSVFACSPEGRRGRNSASGNNPAGLSLRGPCRLFKNIRKIPLLRLLSLFLITGAASVIVSILLLNLPVAASGKIQYGMLGRHAFFEYGTGAGNIFIWLFLFIISVYVEPKVSSLISGRRDKNYGSGISGSFAVKACGGSFAGYSAEKPFDIGFVNRESRGASSEILVGIDRKKRFEHIMVVSPTGGGKTSRYVIPGIKNDAGYPGVSVFAVDIDSPYLYGAASEDWKKAGKKTVLFDPYRFKAEPGGRSAFFNPLVGKNGEPESDEKLFEISSLLFSPDERELKGGDAHAYRYYSRRASGLFYGCLLYIKYKYGPKFLDLPTAKNFLEKGAGFIVDAVNGFSGEGSKKVKGFFNPFMELPAYDRPRVISDTLNSIDFLNDSSVAFHLKQNIPQNNPTSRLYIDDLFASDMLIVAGIPREKLSAGGDRLMSFLARYFMKSVYENRRNFLRKAEPAHSEGAGQTGGAELNGKHEWNDRSVFIYLDEFPALSLGDFDIELANLRKTNAGVCLTTQDLSFIKERYGDISLITANVGTQIVMGHPAYETCEYYSKISGERYVFHKEKLRKGGGGTDFLFSGTAEAQVASGMYPVISSDELRNMDGESVFVYSKFARPFILRGQEFSD